MRRADRLIKIVHFLRRRRRAVTASRIAEEFSICTRTVYRDIQALMDSGVPISGEAGVGYIIDKQYYLPPITFDTDELEAIGLGISMVRQWTDEQFAAKAVSAFEKIQAVLPAQLQAEMQQISTFAVSNGDKIPWTVSFSSIRESIRRREKICIEYCDESKKATSRTIRPIGLFFFSPVWVLTGWCELRRSFRNFRLDRIKTLQPSGVTFENEPEKDLSAYLKLCVEDDQRLTNPVSAV